MEMLLLSLWLSFCRYCIYQQHYVAAEERNISSSSSNNFLHHIRCSSATASFQDFPPLGFFRRLVVMLTWLVVSVVPSFFFISSFPPSSILPLFRFLFYTCILWKLIWYEVISKYISEQGKSIELGQVGCEAAME